MKRRKVRDGMFPTERVTLTVAEISALPPEEKIAGIPNAFFEKLTPQGPLDGNLAKYRAAAEKELKRLRGLDGERIAKSDRKRDGEREEQVKELKEEVLGGEGSLLDRRRRLRERR